MASGSVSVGVSGGYGGASAGVGVSADTNVNVGVGVSTNTNINSGVSIGVVAEGEEATNTTEELSDALRSFSVCVVCTLCKSCGATTNEPSWNILNCLFAYFCTEFWCCYTCYKRKDWTCYNAKHCCTSCKQYIDTYRAC